MKEIRYGIIGTGRIAETFARACAMTEGSRIVAVASRSLERAEAFAGKFEAPHAFGSVEEMVQGDLVDCVYVAVPHPMHFENSRIAILHGKPVLCEKPMCMNKAEAEALFALAKEKGVFLMEAMWSRFQPNNIKAMKWLKSGEIGTLKFIDMQFSFYADLEAAFRQRLVKPELGGGSMYDLGVYTVEMASWFAGANPLEYSGFCTDIGPGSDATTAMALRYPEGILATSRTGVICDTLNRATLMGTKGRIEIDTFHLAPVARLYHGKELVEESVETDEPVQGFTWQIKAVSQYVRDGVLESDVVPAKDTIATADVLGTMMKRFYPEFYSKN